MGYKSKSVLSLALNPWAVGTALLLGNVLGSHSAILWKGPNTNWTKSGSTPSDTILAGKVVLTRGSRDVLYNTAAGETSAGLTSPKDTMWAFGTLNNYSNLTYQTLESMRDGNLALRLIGKDMVMHLINEDIYLSVKFTAWGKGGAGTVAYTRSTPSLVDLTPPNILCITNQIRECVTPGGQNVSFTVTATDAQDGSVPVTCSPESGSKFPLGLTPVTCTASDNSGNRTNCSFDVLLIGDTAPPNIVCPGNQIRECVPLAGEPVSFSATAMDLCNGSLPVTCSPQSGSVFPLGLTVVTCTASDNSGNQTNCSFNVLLIGDTTPPNIVCPENQIRECVALEGEPASFTATATDLCDGSLPVTCSPPSGSVFRLGATTVTCSASDHSGNQTNCSFVVLLIGTQCDGEYHLTTSASAAGKVDSEPFLEPYPCGTCVQLTAVPAGGWKFLGWLGDLSGTNRVTNITVTANKCVTAVFAARVLLGASSNGLAKLDPPADLFPFNSAVRLLAIPEPGYYFDHWTNAVTSGANPFTLTITRSTSIVSAVFLPLPQGRFALTVTPEGSGRVSGFNTALDNSYPAGSNLVLRAIPEIGQDFLGWSGDLNGTDNPATIDLNATKTITARFTKRPSLQIVQCSGKLADQTVRLQVKGRLLESHLIEASPSLSDRMAWRTVAVATNTLGAVQYNDPLGPGTAQRFYRARLEN